MKIFYGKCRIVIVINLLAIKLPKIRVLKVFSQILKIFYKPDSKRRLLHLLNSLFADPTMYGTTARFLFLGIVENWQEFQFWKKYGFKFLAPTYFSLFGLINFQKAGAPYQKENDIWPRLLKWDYHMTFKDAHTFGEPENFCLINGMVKIVDYGNNRSQEVLVNWGKNHDSF